MTPAPQLDPPTAAEAIAAGALPVDVREVGEWEAGHIAGAVLLPLGELGARFGELPRDRRLVVVCRTGSRSEYAADALHGAGYQTENLRGGLQEWVAHGLPLEPADGYVL
ncbi:MAG TPA: rhodanese-like domain-containing protein [Gaiellales bacterium]|nr:rhodanese-like domain-containing protein [Gaiellales bacterium]